MQLGTLVVRARLLVVALVLGAGSVGAAAQVVNGSFETGDFTGWTATDLSNPLTPLQVAPLGAIGYFGANNTPTDGDFSAVTGFDGNGPGTISLTQDVTVSKASSLLLVDYLAQWEFFGGAVDRTFRVVVQEAGGGTELASIEVLRAHVSTTYVDTDRVTAAVDLAAFAGQEVQLGLSWDVPESFTGPAFFDLDNVRLVGKKLPALDAASLKIALNFAAADKDSVKLDLIMPVPLDFQPEGQTLMLTVGDLVKSFTLDANGAAQDGADSVKLLAVSKQDGYRKLALSCAQGDFAGDLSAYGLTDADTDKAGSTVAVPVTAELDGGAPCATTFLAVYKAVAGKSGKAAAKAASEAWTTKLAVNLNLALADEDSISLKTVALAGAGFAPDGEEIVVEIGGVTKTFTLGADGKAVNGDDSIALKRDSKNPARQLVTLACKLGNFGDVSDEFFSFKGETPPGGLQVVVPVSVTLDGQVAKSVVVLNYTAKAGKTGKAKN